MLLTIESLEAGSQMATLVDRLLASSGTLISSWRGRVHTRHIPVMHRSYGLQSSSSEGLEIVFSLFSLKTAVRCQRNLHYALVSTKSNPSSSNEATNKMKIRSQWLSHRISAVLLLGMEREPLGVRVIGCSPSRPSSHSAHTSIWHYACHQNWIAIDTSW